MTFEQFQASRRHCADIGEQIKQDMGVTDPVVGNVYLDGTLYIEGVRPWWPQEAREQGNWHLLIGNVEWISSDLEKLERKLYDFAVSEGYSLQGGAACKV